MGIVENIFLFLSRKTLLKLNLDYADVIYDKPFNESFEPKIETTQYRAALAITGAIKGTSRDLLYQEIG